MTRRNVAGNRRQSRRRLLNPQQVFARSVFAGIVNLRIAIAVYKHQPSRRPSSAVAGTRRTVQRLTDQHRSGPFRDSERAYRKSPSKASAANPTECLTHRLRKLGAAKDVSTAIIASTSRSSNKVNPADGLFIEQIVIIFWYLSTHLLSGKLKGVINLALQLAQQAQNQTSPNPAVGCVLVSATGDIIGQGQTQAAGCAHAEVMALRDAASRGHDTTGATAFVTLEPCSHHGRTGPCCDAFIAAGIAKVVASIADPNPLVSGQGFERLRAAGIAVEVGPGAEASRELNIGFFSRMLRQTPWVRMKMAASLDGTTALANGQSQWITSLEARTDGHAWRARASAVLTGIGTLLQDDPSLDVRLVETPRQPHRIIIDSQLQTPLTARIFKPEGQVWIYTASTDAAKTQALQSCGASVISLPGANGKVDLAAVLRDLGQRQINDLHVESGFKLNGSLVREGLVDEFLLYLAPKLLGPGQGLLALPALQSLTGAVALEFISADRVGPDLRLVARMEGRSRF